MSVNILSFIVVLGVLIFFHELGHFIFARIFGVGVEKFSLGFGPKLLSKTVGMTEYRLSAIPLGGYVKMVGEEPGADLDPAEISISFTHKHVLKRIMIVAAGPFFNLLLAVLIFFGLFWSSGTYTVAPTVGEVGAGSPAEKAGLRPGDTIVSINGKRVSEWDEMARLIVDSGGAALTVDFRREGEILTREIVPETRKMTNIFGEEIQRPVIGITASGDVTPVPLNMFESAYESVVQTYRIAELTVVSIVKLIQGRVSPKTLGGPIMIAQMSGQQAKEGLANLVFFIALISINLGILNFLPIPVLDGGHLLFFLIELIIRRPVNIRVREIAQQVGLFILILLMVYVFYNDLARIFFS